MLAQLAAFLGVSAVVICTPGQDTALTVRNVLAGGRANGVATAAGVALGQAAWTVAAAAGLVAVLHASQPAFHALRLAGAAYLVLLGLRSLHAALTGRHAGTAAARPSTSGRAMREGLLSNLANPKMAAFFTSLLPQFAPDAGAAFPALLLLGLTFCLLTFLWLSAYSIAVARARHVLASARVRRALDAALGVVLVGLGVRLALARQP
jgi:threonine/homoserine/homoserine lactone efflux protein